MNSRRDGGPVDLLILVASLGMLAAVIAFLAVTDSGGAEPIPLPTAPTTVAP